MAVTEADIQALAELARDQVIKGGAAPSEATNAFQRIQHLANHTIG